MRRTKVAATVRAAFSFILQHGDVNLTGVLLLHNVNH